MKLILRILLWVVVIVIVLILLLILLLFILSGRPFVPGNYTEKVKTGGTPEDWGNYIIHYPKEMEYSNKTYPLVVFVNGTGVKASKYPALFEHLASWGFIVIGNEDPSTFSGDSANASIAFLLEQNEEKNSLFYHKVDTAHIGISGHSQGGVGVFNALKDETYGKLYTCAVSLSPTEMELAEALHIPYNPEGINTPVMVIASEEQDVITKEGVEKSIHCLKDHMFLHCASMRTMGKCYMKEMAM